LTHEQTRWIFETRTIGAVAEDIPVDDIVETANHFRCLSLRKTSDSFIIKDWLNGVRGRRFALGTLAELGKIF
jgi:hypothetical protein